MAIIGVLLAAVAAIGVWYYRLKMLRDVSNDVADVAGKVRGAYRMRKFRKKAEGATLNAIDEPAMAAAVFLHALANEDRKTLHKSEPLIRERLTPIVADDLDEFLSYAAWAARDVIDPRDLVRRFKPLWRETLSLSEREELIGMAEDVAAQSEAGEPGHTLTLDMLRTALR